MESFNGRSDAGGNLIIRRVTDPNTVVDLIRAFAALRRGHLLEPLTSDRPDRILSSIAVSDMSQKAPLRATRGFQHGAPLCVAELSGHEDSKHLSAEGRCVT